jgi:hypothetical protein
LPPQQVAEVHGIDIRYFDVGEKMSPVVLLLHGMGDRAANHMGTAAVLVKTLTRRFWADCRQTGS